MDNVVENSDIKLGAGNPQILSMTLFDDLRIMALKALYWILAARQLKTNSIS
jgi:hypothetical protein